MDVAQRLRAAITDGRFQPNERLVEADLAGFLDTSRANVRTVLARLEQEGLVVSEPNRGARVRRISDAEALEITEARGALETLVAGHAARRATAEDCTRLEEIVGEMRRAVAAGDLMGYSTLNGRFHGELQRIAGHATALRLLAALTSQVVRFQYRAILIPGRAARSLAEHEEIAAAVRAGDAHRAEGAMRHHLHHVVEALGRAMAEHGAAL